MKHIYTSALALIMLAMVSLPTQAQVVYNNEETGQKLELFHMYQFWGTYQTMDDDRLPGGDAHFDMNIRRGRFGAKGKVNKLVDFQVWYAFDLLGKDPGTNWLNGMFGTNTSNQVFQVWDAFFKFKFDPKYNVTVGFFRPQTSRESIRSGFTTLSFEKTFPNFIHRTYTVSSGPGRVPGVNLGGTFKGSGMGMKYDFGMFNAFVAKENFSPMFAGRLAFWLGDEEKGGLRDNHFGKRNGVTLAFYGTSQSAVDQSALTAISITNPENAFNPLNSVSVLSYGSDLLANYGNFNLKAEYSVITYSNLMGDTESATGNYTMVTYDVAAAYNIAKIGPGLLAATAAYTGVAADEALELGTLSIIDKKYANQYGKVAFMDFGFNYYLKNDKYRIALHYVNVMEEKEEYNNDHIALGLQFQW